MGALLEVKDINKSFGQIKVLKDVSFELDHGELVSLVGENGAGKSTLMNILGGILKPTSGSISFQGVNYAPQSPLEAQESGIAFIHQELNLFPNLSIAENLFIADFPTNSILGVSRISKRDILRKAEDLLERVGLNVSPSLKVESLSAAQQQLVEIAKALSRNPQVIIFDEPTTALSRHEVQQLFDLIRELKQQGITMIYISHNLEDVMDLSDRIIILRDGELIKSGAKSSFTLQSMVTDMVGRKMEDFFPERESTILNEALLQVKDLSAKGFVKDINYEIKKNEVVGFYGLVGAGRSELSRIIFGLDDYDEGEIRWKNHALEKSSPTHSINRGMAFLTEDRREEGLLIGMSILKNAQLAGLSHFIKGVLSFIDRKKVKQEVSEKVEATHTKLNSLTDQSVSTLSGGNQQKVVLSKWLMTQPELLILDEPTKGIDIAAKREIYELINDLVVSGSSVMMVSSEIEELIGMCDRILVMSNGSITASFEKEHFDRNEILEAALLKNELVSES